MTVHFIGAGPGAADLLTLRAASLLASSPVCLYAGSLVPEAVLAHCPPQARLIDTQHLTLDQILEQLFTAHTEGLDVARLCSGDPSIYSALGEQLRRLEAAGVPYDICPGVPAFAAAAASLHRELTLPGVAQSVVLTRASAQATPMPSTESLAIIGASRATMVLHLAAGHIQQVVAELIPVYGEQTPAAVVAYASRPEEVTLRGTLATIAQQTAAAGIRRTAVIVVGDALGVAQFCDSHLYSAERHRG